ARIPHLHGLMLARREQPRAVGAEGDGRHPAEVGPDERPAARAALALQVMPLPVSELGRALVEQLLDPGRVAGAPLAAGQGDVAQVELGLGLPAGLGLGLSRRLGGSPLGWPPAPPRPRGSPPGPLPARRPRPPPAP